MNARIVLSTTVAVLVGLFGTACFYFTLDIGDVPCNGPDAERCQEPQQELQSSAQDSCQGEGRRLCLVPLGQVSPDLIQHLVDHYREQYGRSVAVLRPLGVPDSVIDPDRDQVGGIALTAFMHGAFPDASADPDAVLIGVTPLDMYYEDADWRFSFGVRGSFDDPEGVVSTFRMNPETFGEEPDDDLLFSRARTMVSKYVGLLFYGLEPSPDPESPMFDSILSLGDLDRMGEPLPVGR